MGVDITVTTRQQEYFPGDVVEGTVKLVVTARGDEGSSADALVLRLFGLARTKTVDYNPVYTMEQIEEVEEFLGHDLQLASFGGKAPAGTYDFPFSVVLPSVLTAPSMKEKGTCASVSVEYGFKARLDRPGLLHRDAKAEASLTVLPKPEDAREAVPLVVGPDTQKVKKAFIFGSGTVSIGFRVDRTAVGLNAPLGLTVVGRNDSSSRPKALHIEIWQFCKWTAKKHKDKAPPRTIASIEIPGSELGALLRPASEDDADSPAADVEGGAAEEELRQQLAAGAGTRYEIRVPGNSLLTLRGNTFEVMHALTVRLETAGTSTSSPEVSTPLLIHPGTAAGIVAPPPPSHTEEVEGAAAAAAAPFATLKEMDASGKMRPVVVPESAVTATYPNELPKGY